MIRAVIVDDEAPARSELRYLLADHDDVTVAGEAAGAAEGFALACDPEIDVVFLDIEMPGVSGLAAAPLVRERADPPAVVFVTAHAEYAVDAFAVEAFDYLLKPVDPDRLARVVERLRDRSRENALPVDTSRPTAITAVFTPTIAPTSALRHSASWRSGSGRGSPASTGRTSSISRRSPPCAAPRRTASASSSRTPARRSSTSRADSRDSSASG